MDSRVFIDQDSLPIGDLEVRGSRRFCFFAMASDRCSLIRSERSMEISVLVTIC
ncbi:hypothetical protein U1Q18_016169 [Sarracenia purpurea var. burkii]